MNTILKNMIVRSNSCPLPHFCQIYLFSTKFLYSSSCISLDTNFSPSALEKYTKVTKFNKSQ